MKTEVRVNESIPSLSDHVDEGENKKDNRYPFDNQMGKIGVRKVHIDNVKDNQRGRFGERKYKRITVILFMKVV
jgi:hypothetical protein